VSRILIKQYKPCDGAKALADGLNGQRIKCEGSTYRYQAGDIVINWGFSGTFDGRITYNQPAAIREATDKRRSFRLFDHHRVPTLRWTTDPGVAASWCRDGKRVYGRTASGMAGLGITVYEPHSSVGSHELYTEGFATKREFRVHVVGGKAVHTMEKKKVRDYEGTPDPLVRSHRRGWVFCIRNLDPIPSAVQQAAIGAVKALGLDFGGVDIGLDVRNNVVVFEVNTAPGLEGSTIPAYINRFKEMINESQGSPEVGRSPVVREIQARQEPAWNGVERRVASRRCNDREVSAAIEVLLSRSTLRPVQQDQRRQA